jgi:hypothetical protein
VNWAQLLVLPLLLLVLGVLHMWLPSWEQWWNWGQFMPMPLAFLIVSRWPEPDPDGRDGTWYGGHMEGPWGPP